jgi:hypothetical protein
VGRSLSRYRVPGQHGGPPPYAQVHTILPSYWQLHVDVVQFAVHVLPLPSLHDV